MNLATPAPLATDDCAQGAVARALVKVFFENIPDFVHFKDRDGRFIAVSKSKLVRNGLKHRDEIIGKTDFDFFAESNARRAKADEDEVMRTGVPTLNKLEHVRWADGRETWSLVNKLPLRDEDGAIIGTFGITQDITAQKRIEQDLERTQTNLVDASRVAGMAEVATGVLHNVGNVLTSLNVSSSVVADGLRQSKADSLAKLSALLQEHTADLGEFLTLDPKGRRIPEFIESLARQAADERDRLLDEIASLQKNVDHIKEIVSMQQAYATMTGVSEPLDAVELLEDSLRMNAGSLIRHAVRVERDVQPVPKIQAERGKVLQILVNLIRNAKYAADEGGAADKVITLRIGSGLPDGTPAKPGAPGRVFFAVQDNGIGIAPENLTRIFAHGFTTRKNGHGFGLHSAANAAREMKGALTVHSAGLGLGATFTLDLPAASATSAP